MTNRYLYDFFMKQDDDVILKSFLEAYSKIPEKDQLEIRYDYLVVRRTSFNISVSYGDGFLIRLTDSVFRACIADNNITSLDKDYLKSMVRKIKIDTIINYQS